MSNAGLFSTVAREYANFRPGYPPELFAWLARISPSREAVWDCGCGSGQASVALAEHFAVVHATDVAPEQIDAAKPHPRVRYSVAPAENSGLAGPVCGSGDRRAGAALVRRDGLLRRGGARRAPGSAAGGMELSATAVRRRGTRPALLRVLLAGGRAVLAATNAGTSRRATGRCRFRSRKSRLRSSASSSTGTSTRSRAT